VVDLCRSRGYGAHLRVRRNGPDLVVGLGGFGYRLVRAAAGCTGGRLLASRTPNQNLLAAAIEKPGTDSVYPNPLRNISTALGRSLWTPLEGVRRCLRKRSRA
jgi:hypothetical protein